MRFDEVIKKYGYPIIGKRQAEAIDLGRKNIKENKYTSRLAALGIDISEAEEMGLTLPSEEMLARYKRTHTGSKYTAPKYKPLLFTDFEASANCCDVMKKRPIKAYAKATGRRPIIATMATESRYREQHWLKDGCNAFTCGNTNRSGGDFAHDTDPGDICIKPVLGCRIHLEFGIDCLLRQLLIQFC